MIGDWFESRVKARIKSKKTEIDFNKDEHPREGINLETLSSANCSASGGGVMMHQRSLKSSAKPAFGPECSVPATGWAGIKCIFFEICGLISSMTDCLTEPTSLTIVPGANIDPIFWVYILAQELLYFLCKRRKTMKNFSRIKIFLGYCNT